MAAEARRVPDVKEEARRPEPSEPGNPTPGEQLRMLQELERQSYTRNIEDFLRRRSRRSPR